MNHRFHSARRVLGALATVVAVGVVSLSVLSAPAGAESPGNGVDPLAAWHQALDAAAESPADVVFLGDSITQGYGAEGRSSWWVDAVRTGLQARWGGSGTGYRAATASFWRPDPGGWSLTGTRADTTRGLGLNAQVLETPTAEVSAVVDGAVAEVRYQMGPGGGTMAVAIDGLEVALVDTRAEVATGGQVWRSEPLGAGSHQIQVRAVDGSSDRSVVVEGILDGGGSGVRVWAAGHGGYGTSHFVAERGWEDSLRTVTPDLVVIELGTNDYTFGLTGTQLEANLLTLVERIEAAAGGPVSIALAPVWNGAGRSASRFADLVAAQRRVAAARGLALIDLSTVDPSLVTADGVHPDAAGQRILATAVQEAIDPAFDAPLAPVAPGAITLTADGADGSVQATWSATAADRFVARLVDTATGKAVAEQRPSSPSVSFAAALPGTTYAVVVFAGNDTGFSAGARSVSLLTPGVRPVAPVAPAGVKAVYSVGSRTAELSWTASAGATEYVVLAYDLATGVPTSRTVTSTSVSYPGLVAGRSYVYGVYARNSIGLSAGVASNTVVVPAPPAVPTEVKAVYSVGSRTVELSWTASAGATEYVVLAYDLATGVPTSRTVTSTSVSYPGLVAGRSYVYGVYARNSIGLSAGVASNTIVMPSAPGAPTGVTAVSTGSRSVELSWTASAGATEYVVLAYDLATGVPTSRTVTSTSVSYSGLVAGRSYVYGVYARNSIGLSVGVASNTVVAAG